MGSQKINIFFAQLTFFLVFSFIGKFCGADIFFSPVCNLTAGEAPQSISHAMRVMNCRAQRASAASE